MKTLRFSFTPLQMLEAMLPLSLERVFVSGKSIVHQDADVITFAKDLFCDTHPASSPESEKRNVLCEKKRGEAAYAFQSTVNI